MTPSEYIKIEKEQNKIIAAAEKVIFKARQQADKCTPPEKHRPAVASDIKEGAIIWHSREKKYGGDYWHVVSSPEHYGDAFKAYTADDGCRYGLDGAYIELRL